MITTPDSLIVTDDIRIDFSRSKIIKNNNGEWQTFEIDNQAKSILEILSCEKWRNKNVPAQVILEYLTGDDCTMIGSNGLDVKLCGLRCILGEEILPFGKNGYRTMKVSNGKTPIEEIHEKLDLVLQILEKRGITI
mgnify:CR=1 FL=1